MVIKQTMKDSFKPFEEMLYKKRSDISKQSRIDASFKSSTFGKFCRKRNGTA